MLAQVLKQEIELFHQKVRVEHPLFKNTRLGKLKKAQMAVYLESILFLIEHTPIHLKQAAVRADELGLSELRRFFTDKMGEEEGHDQWAKNDLKHFSDKAAAKVPASMRMIVKYISNLIESDPYTYLSYILFAEYFTVLCAPEWLADLESKCGISREFMSVIGNHAELDKDHVVDDLHQIENLANSRSASSMTPALHGAMDLFENFFLDIAETSPIETH